jgi:hypothetical protein
MSISREKELWGPSATKVKAGDCCKCWRRWEKVRLFKNSVEQRTKFSLDAFKTHRPSEANSAG